MGRIIRVFIGRQLGQDPTKGSFAAKDCRVFSSRRGLSVVRIILIFLLGGFAFGWMVPVWSDEVIYDDALQNNWQDWGWAERDYANTSPVASGERSIRVRAGTSQALYLGRATFDNSEFAGVSFKVYGESPGGQRLALQGTLESGNPPSVALPFLTGGTWEEIIVSFDELGIASASDQIGLWIVNVGGLTAEFYVDDIVLLTELPITHVTVDPTRGLAPIDPRIFGINTAIYDEYIGSQENEDLVTPLKLGSVRFPGGNVANNYDWHRGRSTDAQFDWDTNFPEFALMAEEIGAEPYVSLNYGTGTPEQAAAWVAYANALPADTTPIGFDALGRDWKTAGYWATMRASDPIGGDAYQDFLRISRPEPFGITYWEVGNENYGNWSKDVHGTTYEGFPHNPSTYAEFFRRFRDKILQVDPTVKLGAVLVPEEDFYPSPRGESVPNPFQNWAYYDGWTPIVLTRLREKNVVPDFVIYHSYPQKPGQESDSGLLASAGERLPSDISEVFRQVREYLYPLDTSNVEIAVTELNSVTESPGKQTTSLVNALFLADAVAGLPAAGAAAVHWWSLRNQAASTGNSSGSLHGWRSYSDYGILARGDSNIVADNTKFPTYHALHLLSHWGRGEATAVEAISDHPLLSVHAARHTAGGTSLLIVNRSPTEDIATLIDVGETVESPSAPLWSYGRENDINETGLSSDTLIGISSSFEVTFPSYSITVITIETPALADPPNVEQPDALDPPPDRTVAQPAIDLTTEKTIDRLLRKIKRLKKKKPVSKNTRKKVKRLTLKVRKLRLIL